MKKLREQSGPFRVGRDTLKVFQSTLDSIKEYNVSYFKCLLLFPLPCCKNKREKLAKKKALERYSAHLDVQSMIESDLIVKHVF